MVVSLTTVTARGRFDQRLVQAEGGVVGPGFDQMRPVAGDGDGFDRVCGHAPAPAPAQKRGGEQARTGRHGVTIGF